MKERSIHVGNVITRQILRVFLRHTRINIIRVEHYNHRLKDKHSQKDCVLNQSPTVMASWYVRSLYSQNQLLKYKPSAAGQILDILKLRLTQPQVELN
jgi:hypothetical protein